ncbi:leucine-rich repeat domain-containing protein [Galactobacillus timonensis]|uniref:leucine-rich repeat domain-containing protein n=1 Tax=Galactobacillus timonensis TaxID=2041840 RepID=UPI000C843F29|nr:leucine-rich repeat protein [Galactobacillus timonensis]
MPDGFSDGDPDEYDPDNDQYNYSEDMFFDPPYEKMADTWDMTERKKVGNSDQLHSCAGKKFVIAGEMKHFQGRDGIVECITADGGKVTENVGKKTDYLVDNIDGYSAKREKAKKLNVPVITEDKFIEMFGGSEKVVDQKKVDIPKPITRNGIIFEEWEYNLLKDGTVRIVNYTGRHSTVKIPSMLDHKELSEIGPDLFSLDDHDRTRRIPREKRKSLEPIRKVYIPGSVKKIGRNAFSCNPVKKVLMEDGTEEIGAYAFSGCQLESIKLPGTLTIIGKGAFEGSQGIKQWNLPECLKVIDDDAFQYSSIYDVYIP